MDSQHKKANQSLSNDAPWWIGNESSLWRKYCGIWLLFALVSLSLQCISVQRRFEESRPIIWDDVCFHHNQLLLQHVYETFQVWQPLFSQLLKIELKTEAKRKIKYILFRSRIVFWKIRLEVQSHASFQSLFLLWRWITDWFVVVLGRMIVAEVDRLMSSLSLGWCSLKVNASATI